MRKLLNYYGTLTYKLIVLYGIFFLVNENVTGVKVTLPIVILGTIATFLSTFKRK